MCLHGVLSALPCSDAGAVVWACAWGALMLVSVPAWGAECLDVLRPKAVDWAS